MTDVPFTIRYTKPLTAVPRLRYAIEAAISTTVNPPKTLPPALELARTLGIARNTAFRAYRLLADAGLVASDRGAGTAIKPYPGDHPDVIELAQDLIDQAHGEGMELPYLHALLANLWPAPTGSAHVDPPSAAIATATASAPLVPVPEAGAAETGSPTTDIYDQEDFL